MKKLFFTLLCATMMLSSCGTYTGSGALTGAALGGIIGSAMGGLGGGPRGHDLGTLVGMGAGAAIGAAAGAQADKEAQERQAYYQGRPVKRVVVTETTDGNYDAERAARIQGYHDRVAARYGVGNTRTVTTTTTTTTTTTSEPVTTYSDQSVEQRVKPTEESCYDEKGTHNDTFEMQVDSTKVKK